MLAFAKSALRRFGKPDRAVDVQPVSNIEDRNAAITDRVCELLNKQQFEQTEKHDAPKVLRSILVMQDQPYNVVDSGIKYIRRYEDKEYKNPSYQDFVGIVTIGQREAAQVYIVKCRVNLDLEGLPQMGWPVCMQAQEFLDKVGTQDAVKFLDKMQRPRRISLKAGKVMSAEPN